MAPKQIYRQFCKDMLSQLSAESQECWFDETEGLCSNLVEWLRHHEFGTQHGLNVLSYQHELFRQYNQNAFLPFNLSLDEHRKESKNGKIFSNEQRLAHLKQFAA